MNLGWVHSRCGDLDAADAAFTESLHDFEQSHQRLFSCSPLLGLACSAAARHDWERAARLLGFADGQLEGCGVPWSEPERTYREQLLGDVQRQLGTGFENCYDSGRTGDRGDLIDLALDQHT
jgi:hypothetical protein